jgi:cell fate (sporulation/competence/biofilm development) regulator YlbF (YheA/YmcA/DUF963 family)
MLSADVERAGRALAEEITRSLQMGALAKTKECMNLDRDAQRVLRGLEEKQDELLEAYGEGREASMEQIAAIKHLQRELQANPSVLAHAQAQRTTQDLLLRVAKEISELLGVNFGLLAKSRAC